MITITPTSLRCRRSLLAVKTAIASTIFAIRQYTFSFYDIQYIFLLFLFSFCYSITDTPTWFKLPISLFAISLLFHKHTRIFMLPFLAIAGWLILFYCCRFIPSEWRPHIYTSVLPTLDNIIYGGNLSNMLSSETAPWKDLLAWFPYGILHFTMPVVLAILIVFYAPSGTLPVFARTFGYMNIAGVLTQLIFPCAPPWYELIYGPLQPAEYSMPGDPGGLIRVDDILGTHMYRSTFTASPLVFGAFPSLHSGCAWQLAFFTVYVFGPRSIPFALFYVFWIWWAAMYLGHHYVVDLVGGGCYAIIAFWIGSSFLPSVRSYSDMLMGSTEKQTFVQSFNHYYPIGARRSEEDWGLELNDRDMKAKEVPSDSVVMEVEEGAGGMGCDESSFQSWNGWQGYESWVMVILSARSGYSISQRVPIASTRFKDKGLFQELSNNVQQEQQEQQQQQQQQQQHEQQRQQQQQPEHVNLDYETKYITPQSPPGLVASVAEEVTASSACNVAISAGTGEADEGIKRLTRSVRLSFSPSSSVSGSSLPNSPMKANFLEPDVAVAAVVPGLLLTIPSSLSSSSSSATTTLSSPSSSSPSCSPISSSPLPSPLSSTSFLSSISSLSLPNLTGAGTTEQGRESNPGLFHARSSSDTSSSNLFMSATTAVMTSIAMTTTTTTTTTTATTTNPGVNISANKRFKDD